MLSFVRRSRRVAVAFFAVLALSTHLVQLRRAAPAAGRGDARRRRGRVRPDRGRLRRRRPLRRALPRHARQGEPSPAARRSRWASACSSSRSPRRRSLAPVCVLLFLTGGCYMLWGASALASLQLAAPRAPARAGGEPLLCSRSWAARRSAACSPAGSRHAAARSSRSRSPAPRRARRRDRRRGHARGPAGVRRHTDDISNRRRGLNEQMTIATRTAGSALPHAMSRRRSGSTPAPGALRRTTSPRVSTGRSPPPPPSSRRSPATSRRWRWSRSTSAGSSTCRTSATLRATILEPHRAGRRRAADQHVAHPRRRERQLAAGGQARRRADRALHRAPDRADRRGDPRGARRRWRPPG